MASSSISPSAPLDVKFEGMLAYRQPGNEKWLSLSPGAHELLAAKDEDGIPAPDRTATNRSAVNDALYGSLQYANLGFLAGSGTSLGPAGGPSMTKLWSEAMCKGKSSNELTDAASAACQAVRYLPDGPPNIEHFLSQCDAYLAFDNDEKVTSFVVEVKREILKQCTTFLTDGLSDITAYQHLLQKLARRRVRDPRLRVFTTNYDMCFENAAADLGITVVDGFSYTRRRRFDGRHFSQDIVRREGDKHEFTEGVFHLYKLHGSVSWERNGKDVFEVNEPCAERACLIYPAKGKYQQAFIQPHLELLSRFLDFLRQPNTCLIVSGFGFNDDHLSEPILSAIQSNPSMRLILTDYRCYEHLYNKGQFGSSHYWGAFEDLASRGYDIHFISSSFSDFIDLIPSLRAVTPAEQLANAINRVIK